MKTIHWLRWMPFEAQVWWYFTDCCRKDPNEQYLPIVFDVV